MREHFQRCGRAKNAKIVATQIQRTFKDMFKLHNREFVIVHDGDKLDIGGKTLQFFETLSSYGRNNGYLQH